ncbi:NADH-quinone oxidoreductase subunit N [Flammeovirga kamogawensis]|uniref:NADH-quinone oxidoreductase subunit N n=1 Tax=Flammeovirga kamogawensis TaxID=373891 RepID=A0ABX8GXJ0_9BACT|nr:NADH-quinone oxidoreductase subunit N [Flammeovirga kamogawensis]MBB6461087.1 NADH-quinone oxidoreductase subunit N [Flammeovirga kamogawensis]QWG07655.1 NADH-quinone oxidoreductase subunit N [Flammeovirga kamogawensis]TRX69465.1 NADH-quinone oxidoreductase subunit N [Flammeovirga kamogawensis]
MEIDLLSKLADIIDSIPFLVSEIGIISILLGVIIVDLLPIKFNRNFLYLFALIGVIVDIIYLGWFAEATTSKLMLFTVNNDQWSIKIRILEDFCAVLLYLHLFFNKKKESETQKHLSGQSEWAVLTLGMLLGAHFLAMANDFIIAILAVELISLPSYLLTAFNNNKISSEASIRYFLYGAVATAITIYGASILFGLTTAIDFQGIALYNKSYSLLFISATVLLTIGFLFKLGAFPMHIWVPDVYQAAPIEAVAYFSTLPKIGATIFLYRFFFESEIIINPYINYFILMAALLSMFIGNLSGLLQKSMRRLMAYASIAGAGFILIATLNIQDISTNALYYYLVTYVIGIYTIFLFIGEVEKQYNSDKLDTIIGIGWTSNARFWGIGIVLAVMSLIGLPPLAGFTAKLLIFSSLWELYIMNSDSLYLIAMGLGLLNTAIALAYYIKFPFNMYKRNSKKELQMSLPIAIMISILGLSLFILFIVPSILI